MVALLSACVRVALFRDGFDICCKAIGVSRTQLPDLLPGGLAALTKRGDGDEWTPVTPTDPPCQLSAGGDSDRESRSWSLASLCDLTAACTLRLALTLNPSAAGPELRQSSLELEPEAAKLATRFRDLGTAPSHYSFW